MNENPQGMDVFIARQTAKRHLAAVWARLIGLKSGMVVADIGCGPGILTCEYAAMVGAEGLVYAVDNKETYAPRFHGVNNVQFLFKRYDLEIKLERIVDIIFLTDRLQHVSNSEAILNQMFNICGPRTRLLITGYDPRQPGLVGMKRDKRMAPETLVALVEAAGFTHDGVIGAPDEHYALVARRP